MGCHRVDRSRLLRLRAEHPLAKVTDLGLSGLQLGPQTVFALACLCEFEAVALFKPPEAKDSPLVQRLPLLGLNEQFDMLPLGQGDPLLVEGHDRRRRRDIGCWLGHGHRQFVAAHAREAQRKAENVSSDFGVSGGLRAHRMFTEVRHEAL